MWVGLLLVVVSLVVGFAIGVIWYRRRLIRSLRGLVGTSQLPPVPEPEIDHDAMFRILKDWGQR